MPDTLTRRQYAHHRKALGLPGGTVQAVERAFADGRLTAKCKGQDGKIIAEIADAEWTAHTHPTHGGARTPAPDRTPVPPDPDGPPPADPDDPEDPDLNKARAIKEFWLARKAKADALEAEGGLCDRAEVQRACYDWARSFRNRMQSLVPQLIVAIDSAGSETVAREQAAARTIDSALEAYANAPDFK